jgi:DNA polymerase III subunit alpha
MERLDEEFKAIGFYLSGHPLDAYESTLKSLNIMSYVDFVTAAVERGASGGRLAGIVVSARERRSAKGNKFAFAMFSDQTGSFEAVIFSDTLNACGHLLETGTAVVIAVEAERDGDTVKMRVQGLEALDAAAANAMKGLKIVLAGAAIQEPTKLDALRSYLKGAVAPAGRGSEVSFVVRLGDRGRDVDIALPRTRFTLTPLQIGELTTLPGVVDVVEV